MKETLRQNIRSLIAFNACYTTRQQKNSDNGKMNYRDIPEPLE